jgi:hypothetical protein
MPKKLFQKGQSGNPNGRPKKEHCFSDIARQILSAKKLDIEYTFPSGGTMKLSKVHLESDKTFYHSLVCALLKEGLDGNVQAVKELIDRTEGKAIESIDHTTKGEKIVQNTYNVVSAKTAEALKEIDKNGI